MKIIHFIASIDKSKGGTTEYIQLLASQLINHFDIIVCVGYSESPVKMEGVKVKFFNTHLCRWFSMHKEFYNLLKSEKPDIVHINGIWKPENWLFQRAAQKLEIKVILSPHGMLEPFILNRNPLKKKIGLLLYQDNAIRNADIFHATATSEANNIKKLGYQQEISIIPNGIKLADFQVEIPIKDKTPKKILFLSRIHPIKGIEFLIEAWSKLDLKLRENWLVEIIGNGEANYIKRLQEKISKSNLQDQIKIKTPVFGLEKIKIFREASLFVLPTYSENFGIVIAEALASYTPVITTKGAPWDELNTCNAGWCIERGMEPLKNTLEIAMKTENYKLRVMGINGRKLIENKYSIESVSEKMGTLYKEFITR